MILGMLLVGIYLVYVIALERRRRQSSFGRTLASYPAAQRRRWRALVKKNATDHALRTGGIDEVPTVFLLAEKMRLESLQRLRVVSLVMLMIFYMGEGLVMVAVNAAEGVGFLCGAGMVGAGVVITSLRARSTDEPGRRQARYQRALASRGK